MSKNAAAPTDIERSELAQKRVAADLMFVMSDERGRRFIWRELGRCGLHAQTYSPNNSEHCFNAGQRNAAIRLNLDVMSVSPELYLLMQQEAMAAEKHEALLDEAQREQRERERGYNDD